MPSPSTHTLSFLASIGVKTVAEDSLPGSAAADIAALTRRLAAHDENAFREFHRLYFDRLYQFLLVVARGQEHEAGDALQETFLRVLRYARPFATEDAFWGWLKVVARSAACDAGRKNQRYLNLLRNVALHWRGAPQDGGDDELDHLRAIIEECLSELDPHDRSLIEGKYLAESSVRQLATDTGLTDKAVESRLLRLRRDLRKRMLKKLQSP